MKIGELLFNLGFNADTMKLKDFGRAIGDLSMSTIISATNFGVLYETTKRILDVADQAGTSLNTFARETGLSTDALQQWNAEGKKVGVPEGTMEQTFRTLLNSIDLLKNGMTDAKEGFWGMLKIDPTQVSGVENLMDKIMEGLSSLPDSQQRIALSGLGLDKSLLNYLGVWQQVKDNMYQSRDALKIIDEYHKSIADKNTALDKMWKDIATGIAQALTPLDVFMSTNMTKILNSQGWKDAVGTGPGQGFGNLTQDIMDPKGAPGRMWKDFNEMMTKISTVYLENEPEENIEPTVVNTHVTINGDKNPEETKRVIESITADSIDRTRRTRPVGAK